MNDLIRRLEEQLIEERRHRTYFRSHYFPTDALEVRIKILNRVIQKLQVEV